MKKILVPFLALFIIQNTSAQNVSIKVAQKSYSNVDPDGAGPATGSVVIQFLLQYSGGTVLADGMGLSMVYQSSKLMATVANTTVPVGNLGSPPVGSTWLQTVNNRPGNPINKTYNGVTYDRRMIVGFNESSGNPTVAVDGNFQALVEITYWTLGNSYPQGGFITPEPGSILPQNELSSDQGLTTFPYLSPDLNNAVALGGTVPIYLSKFNVGCKTNGVSVSWSTQNESNSNHFEVLKSADGFNWENIGQQPAAINSTAEKNYQYLDLNGSTGLYKIRMVDADGSFTETGSLRSSCEVKSYITSQVYPVPAKDGITLAIKSDKAIKTDLQIIDASGRIVQKLSTSLMIGTTNIPIDVSKMAAGEYLIVSTNPNFKLTKKFIVVR